MASLNLFNFALLLLISHASASTVVFFNKCRYPVWPGIQPSAGQNILAGGGFKLPANKAYTLQLPPLWSGRFWGRHGCTFDGSGRGRCATGDCGGSLTCNGAGGSPPATLAEITLGQELDFYDVSLVDGYNLAMSIMPVKGRGQCSYAGCVSDLNRMCPVGLQVRSRNGKRVLACKSACSAFNSPQYCCTGTFGKASLLKKCNQRSKLSARLHCPVMLSPSKNCSLSFRFRPSSEFSYRSSSSFMLFSSSQHHEGSQQSSDSGEKELDSIKVLLKRGIVVGAVVSGVFLYGCRKVLASAGVVEAGYEVLGQSLVLFKNALPKIYQVLTVLREQGLILAALLSLSAFFSMAETSITTLWPWKVRELAEKEPENGVFRMLRSDVTRFLTTILIGTTVVNIAATALVTEAATAIFGEAGVSAATGLMTVAILLLTEITPKSVAVHNAQEVARLVVRPVAWLSLILYPVGRIVTYLSMGILKILGLKGRSEPYVTEDELKLMLRGAELSGAIEEEEQDMIENVLEIKDTHVREVMTPLVDVVAIDASGSLVDFHSMWVTHQYSRVPVFEQRIDNIVGIAYAMDLLDYVQKGDLLESTSVGDMAHKPAYFVPDSMSVWNLLREFRIRKVHMAVVLNEYGGTIGIVTLEDVVEEIVGEIFDENDSKEEIQKKTGYIVMRDEGVYDVDANTSIDQLSEELNMKMPEGIQYETVSGFVCEAFGYIPKTGESVKVVLEKENWEEEGEEEEGKQERQEQKEKHQIYRVEILAGNARKVSAVRFERVNDMDQVSEAKDVRSMVPKFVRKWSSEEDDGNSTYQEKPWSSEEDDGNSTYQDNKPENAVSDEHVLADK